MVVSNIFYFQPENWGRFPFWRAYFSDGLKPPPRWFCKLLVLHSFGLSHELRLYIFFTFCDFTIYIYIFILTWYCWWTKSCTTKDDEYLNIPLFTGFNHPRWCRILSISSIMHMMWNGRFSSPNSQALVSHLQLHGHGQTHGSHGHGKGPNGDLNEFG